jgi:hypothetical protein
MPRTLGIPTRIGRANGAKPDGFTNRDNDGEGNGRRDVIRMGMTVAVVLAAAVGTPRARADDPSPADWPGPAQVRPAQVPPGKEVFEPGAASVEPEQATDEDAGCRAHQAWVESIHDSP